MFFIASSLPWYWLSKKRNYNGDPSVRPDTLTLNPGGVGRSRVQLRPCFLSQDGVGTGTGVDGPAAAEDQVRGLFY